MAVSVLTVFGILATSLLAWRCSADWECEACSYWTFVQPPTPVYPANQQFYYGLADDVCYRFMQPLGTYLDDPIYTKMSYDNSWEDFTGFMYGGDASCDWIEFQRCAGFNSSALALKYKSTIISGIKQIISKWWCPVLRGVYGFTVSSSPKYGEQSYNPYACSGFDFNLTVMCPKPKPFPSGTCNKTAGILPLTVTNVTQQSTQSPNASEYSKWSCFNITSAAMNNTVGSSCGIKKVTQAEIWADDSLRQGVTAVRITKNGGTPYLMTPTWGPIGTNTLRVPLNWNLTEANGGEICFETDKSIEVSSAGSFGAGLATLCIGGKCYVSLYNDKKNCCPVYEAEWPEDIDYWSR